MAELARASAPTEQLPVVAINLSVRNMLSPDFVARAIEVVDRHGIEHAAASSSRSPRAC